MNGAEIDAFIKTVFETLQTYNIPPRAMIYCCLMDTMRLKAADGTEIVFYTSLPGGYNATLYARPIDKIKWIKIYRIRPPRWDLNLASVMEQNGEGSDSEYSGGETEN
jgi:hypothetical protein